MKLRWDDHQVELRDLVTRYLTANPAAVADPDELSSRREWRDFGERLGILGATLPARVGGTGGNIGEGMAIMAALGACQSSAPLLETVVLSGAILTIVGGVIADDLSRRIVAGAAIVTLAALEPARGYALKPIATKAMRDGEGWRINGSKTAMHPVASATHLLVTACIDDDPALFVMATDAAGLQYERYHLLDGRCVADVSFTSATVPAAALMCRGDTVIETLDIAIDTATVAMIAEAVGAMRELLGMTVEHLQQRRQFGRPLSEFQVLQHRVADMTMAIERSVSAMWLAHAALDDHGDLRRRSVSAAKITLNNAIRLVCESCIQMHGASGFVDEAPTSRFVKRLMTIEATFGNTAWHLTRWLQADAGLTANDAT